MAKKPRKKSSPLSDLIDIPEPIEAEDNSIRVNPLTGGVEIDNDDGSITIGDESLLQEEDEDDEEADESFYANLADRIDSLERGRIGEDLLLKIDTDKHGRSQWETMRAKTLELVGYKLDDPKGDVSRSALGMSTSVVRDPTLAQAVEVFRANAYSELCPSTGPVKVKVVNGATLEEGSNDKSDADALEEDLNYYFTTGAPEYYPDMYHMLWWTGLASGTFKKVYKCPLRGRPVSEYVEGSKIIVPNTSTDLKNAPRVTHEVEMDHATLRAMQLAGVYRDITLGEPIPVQTNAVDAKKAAIEGKDPKNQLPEDQTYTLYETYAKINIKGFEHKDKGKATGLPLPYRITIDSTSHEVLEIRRNWDPADDEKIFRPAEIPIVLFPFSTGISRIYGSGLGQMMGNMASALTALMRISIDGGILGNYPGFVKAKGPGRDLTNEIMVPPGGAVEIDTGGLPIQQTLMPVPYKDVSPAVMSLMEQTRGAAKELGQIANMPVAEGKQDAPVGTTLALLEQAQKTASATHRMLWAAQAEEFRLMLKLFRDDPESLWAENKRPAFGNANTEAEREARVARFKKALDNVNIEPVADPNVPSEMHRKLLALFLKQMTAPTPGMPPLYDPVKIDRYIAKSVLKMPEGEFNEFLLPPQAPTPPPPDPRMISAQAAVMNAHTNQMKAMAQAQLGEKTLQSREQIEAAKIGQAHSASLANGGPAPPDPNQARALDLKEMQIHDKRAETMIDAHQKHADRNSKEAVEAMKIVSAAFVHPDSAGVANQEMAGLSGIISPAAQNNQGQPPMSAGGPVDHPAPDHDAEAARQEKLEAIKDAIAIVKQLQKMPPPRYTH